MFKIKVVLKDGSIHNFDIKSTNNEAEAHYLVEKQFDSKMIKSIITMR